MSRCFPYSPPGYPGGAALIESIKLQREKDKAKAERRKEKKEKKRERKKEKAFKICHGRDKESNDNCPFKGSVGSKGGHFQKNVEDEVEQLEKSSITEDYEQQRCLQNPCHSSDSSQGTIDSHKRKRQASPSNSCCHNSGKNIVRICLPQRRQEDSIHKVQVCSPSGRAESFVQQTTKQSSASTRRNATLGQCLIATPEKRLSIVNTVFPVRNDTKVASVSTSENEMQIESLYKSLISDWAPSQSDAANFNDLEWLFETKGRGRGGVKRYQASNDASCCRSTMLWPRALHMPQANDTYALPFTVPF